MTLCILFCTEVMLKFHKLKHPNYKLLTKIAAKQKNEVALNYYQSAWAMFSGSCSCGDYSISIVINSLITRTPL